MRYVDVKSIGYIDTKYEKYVKRINLYCLMVGDIVLFYLLIYSKVSNSYTDNVSRLFL